jgi:hypothetical protein
MPRRPWTLKLRPPFCVLAGEVAAAREQLRTQSVLLAQYVALCGKSGWLKMYQHRLSQATGETASPVAVLHRKPA